MPYYNFKEIWTPLVLVRIRFFRCLNDGSLFFKVGRAPRKQIFGR